MLQILASPGHCKPHVRFDKGGLLLCALYQNGSDLMLFEVIPQWLATNLKVL